MRSLLQKILTCALAAALAAAIPAQAAQSAAIGGKTARIVSVSMDGGAVGRVVTANGTIHSAQNAASLIEASGGDTVVAAVNGMFLNSYYDAKAPLAFPDNCPIILTNLVQDGRTVACGGEQNCIGFTRDGQALIDRVNVEPEAYVNGSGPVRIWSVNARATDPSAVYLITEEVTLPYVMADGTLLMGTVVGSFNGITAYLQSVGVTDAVSLDGGASSMLYENGSFVTSAERNLASAIVITRAAGRAYIPVGGELGGSTGGTVMPVLSKSPVYLNGSQADLAAYNIGGNNYFKLRDICKAMDMGVQWDSAAQAVVIDTHASYTD